MEKICWQITVAAFMQPLQYDLRSPAAKDNSITHAAVARSNLDAAITMRSAETELQNTIELRATGSEIAAPKTDGSRRQSEKKDDFEALFKGIFKKKITGAKMEKICWQITVAAFMQPLQYDLRSPAAKDNSITHAAKRGSNTCNPIYTAGTILQLQSTMEFHRQLLHQHHLQSHLQWGNDPTVANHNGISIGNSSTSTTCNPIYIAGTILQLQITMEFCRPQMHETEVTPHLQCGTDPRMIRPHTRPSRTRRTAEVDHRRSGTHFVWKNTGFRASAISQKRISCETSFKTPSATPPPAPLAIPFTVRERSYSCKSQWNFHRQLIHQHHLQSYLHCGNDPTVANHNGILSTANARNRGDTPFTMRNRSETDPRMIRPHTRPSRTRRTAEVDHRRSGTHFVRKNIGFRASAISQKRISCETSFKTPSATPPPAPLAIPFTVRERS